MLGSVTVFQLLFACEVFGIGLAHVQECGFSDFADSCFSLIVSVDIYL